MKDAVHGRPFRPANSIVAKWQGGQRFDTGRDSGPAARLDGTAETGQSPVDALLSAVAACSAIDVADILTKRRTKPDRLEVRAEGERAAIHPRRLTRILLNFLVDGPKVERVHAERAVRLALGKYCSVSASLADDIEMEWTVTLNGEEGATYPKPSADDIANAGP